MKDLHFQKDLKKMTPKKIIISFNLLFICSILNVGATECPKDKPILIDGECKLEYCTEDQFNSKYCQINNTIAKTQWINNLIIFGEHPFRYLGFGLFSDGSFVIETTSYPEQPKRKFFGLKRDGRPFFTDKINNEETSYYTKDISGQNNKTLEFKGTIIKLSGSENNGKEYYLTLSKLLGNVELFDFDNDEVYHKAISDFTSLANVKSLRHTFFEFSSENSNYYYLFGFITKYFVSKIYLQKHIFNTIVNFETSDSFVSEEMTEEDVYGNEVSCFLTENGLINCFVFKLIDEKPYYYFIKYNNDFTDRVFSRLSSTIYDENTFYKCIHLREEVGVYAYYYNQTNIFCPILLFRYFNIDDNKFYYYLSSEYSSSGIMIKNYNSLNNLLLNDIIKITDNKIAFSSVGVDKDILYITLISLYDEYPNIKLKMRYYLVKLYALYHYKILLDIKLCKYKDILALGLSFCNNENCASDSDEHSAGLILFGYANSSDSSFYLDEYIFEKNINLTDVEIDLKDHLIIENNIFGYILSNIYINDISNCGEYKLYSSKYEDNEITGYYIVELDENIKIEYIGEENYYPILNCKLDYYFKVTEPDIDIYNNYTDEQEGEDENDLFEKKDYYGRLSYLYIKLTQELSSLCENNCDFCLKENKTTCIVCKYGFSLNNENGESNKICNDKIINEITEIPHFKK